MLSKTKTECIRKKRNSEDWNFLSDLCPLFSVALLHQWKRGLILFLDLPLAFLIVLSHRLVRYC
jgi:hypothetical protein